MMGLQLSDLNAPVTKLINCLLAPDHLNMVNPNRNNLVSAALLVLMLALLI